VGTRPGPPLVEGAPPDTADPVRRRRIPGGSKPLHRIYAIITIVTALALLSVGVIALINNLTASSDTYRFLQTTQGQILAEENRVPTVIVVGERLDIPNLRLDGYLRITMPYVLASQLRDIRNRPVATCAPSGQCSIQPYARSDTVTLRVRGTSATGPLDNFTTQKTLTLTRLFSQSGFGDRYNTITIPLSIPVGGDDAIYPQDSYSFNTQISFASLDLMTAGGSFVPVKFGFTPGLISGQMNATSSSSSPLPFSVHLNVKLSRRIVDIVYIYMISLIPLAFALLFLHLLFVNENYRELDLQGFIPALVAAILAILPLRAILVPASIGKLTRVDIVLGIGLVAIVSGALVKYTFEVWRLPGSARD
jgi:hypothetical protein